MFPPLRVLTSLQVSKKKNKPKHGFLISVSLLSRFNICALHTAVLWIFSSCKHGNVSSLPSFMKCMFLIILDNQILASFPDMYALLIWQIYINQIK